MKRQKSSKKRNGHAKPVSLYPLSFDEALSGLLQTKPPPKKRKPRIEIRLGPEQDTSPMGNGIAIPLTP